MYTDIKMDIHASSCYKIKFSAFSPRKRNLLILLHFQIGISINCNHLKNNRAINSFRCIAQNISSNIFWQSNETSECSLCYDTWNSALNFLAFNVYNFKVKLFFCSRCIWLNLSTVSEKLRIINIPHQMIRSSSNPKNY